MNSHSNVTKIARLRAALLDPANDGLTKPELAAKIGLADVTLRRYLAREDISRRPWWDTARTCDKVPVMTAEEFERLQDAPKLLSYRPEVVVIW